MYRTDVVVAVLEKSGNLLEVDLLTISGGEMASIRDALIFIGHAVPNPNQSDPINIINTKVKNTYINTYLLIMFLQSIKPVVKLNTKTEHFKRGSFIDVNISYVVNPHQLFVQVVCILYFTS